MPDIMNLNVRISGSLKDYVTREISSGAFETSSEFVRDLIRRDKEQADEKKFQHLKAELQKAFSAPDSDYQDASADDIRTRAKSRLK